MSAVRRYKRKKKKNKNSLLFYLTLALIISINYSFSLFTTTTDTVTTIDVAKFCIKVNEMNLEQQTSFDIALSSVNNTSANKISPDSEGYFDIEIDPTRN